MPSPTQGSALPPAIVRSDLSLDDLHLLTGIPLSLLAGYSSGRFKPAGTEREVLTSIGRVVDRMTPLGLAVYLDKFRFRLLRRIIPASDVISLLGLRDPGDYHKALVNLCELHRDELEKAIVRAAKRNGYDPAKREANPSD